MENIKNEETRTTKTVTISHAEYEELTAAKSQVSELSQQVQYLLEQMRLARKKQFGSAGTASMKTSIYDDLETDCKKISEYLLQYSEEYMLDIEIEEYHNGETLLAAFPPSKPRIIFLDIYMDGMSGIEIAY